MPHLNRLALAWSGGKDSAIALETLRREGVPVVALVTTVTEQYDRVSIHGVRRSLLRMQADRVGLPLHEVILPPGADNATYERCMEEALSGLSDVIVGVAFGDLFLEDVRAYRERQMAALGLTPVFPLWGVDTGALARRFIGEGGRATLCAVDTEQLQPKFAGRAFDAALLEDLPPGVDPCGERGEFHTFVHDGPMLSAPIPVRTGERVLRDGRFMFCDLLPADGPA